MGGCNSLLSSLESGVVGVGVGALTGGAGTAAAFGIGATALAATNTSCHRDRSALVGVTNRIIAKSITNTITNCSSVSNILQSIDVTCSPDLTDSNISVYEENSGCALCIKEVFDGFDDQYTAERKAWSDGKEVKVRLNYDDQLRILLVRLQSCGNLCKACSFVNLNQFSSIDTSQSCVQNIVSQSTVKTNLQSILTQQLLNNQDVLSGVAKALATTNVSEITEKISNNISSVVNNNFLQQSLNRIKSAQIMQFSSSSSTNVSNISQFNIFNTILEQVTDENVVTRTINDEIFTSIEQVINQQNTLSDVGTAIFQSSITFVSAINSIITKILIATIATLALVMFVIVGIIIYRAVRKTSKRNAELNRKAELLAQRQGIKAF